MKRQFSHLLFPITLALILGVVSVWLNQATELDWKSVSLNPQQPQYLMTQIHAKRFAPDGQIQDEITAKRAWQLPNSQQVSFVEPNLSIMQKGQLLYQVQANQASYNWESELVHLSKNVILDKQDKQPFIAKMATLTVNSNKQLAYTNSLVNVEYGQSTLQAKGLRYDANTGQLDLLSQVKAKINETR